MSVVRRKKREMLRNIEKHYPKTLLGNWEVTALQTDSKKSSVIGTFAGNVFDIAKRLSGIKCYLLEFKKVSDNRPTSILLNSMTPMENKFAYIAIVGMPLITYDAMILLQKLAVKNPPTFQWNLVSAGRLKLEFLK
jgi:hypothetical protein